MLSGSVFQADGPACERTHSPNFDCNCGRVKMFDDVDLRHCRNRGRLAPTDCTIFRLVVKTGSAKTKTKTANGSMKQNAHSSRKNYFYQKLQRH